MRVPIALLLVGLTSCSGHNEQLAQRRAYWEAALQQNVPVGTTKDQIMSWGLSQGVEFRTVPPDHWLYANVESVPVEGIKFPCSQWNIILKVSLDASDRAAGHEISQVGTCL